MRLGRKHAALAVAVWTVLLTWIGVQPCGAEEAYVNADLPPLLQLLDGTPVRTAEDFQRRRQEIRRLLCQHFLGSFPEKAPAVVNAEVLREQKPEDGSTRRQVRLTCGSPGDGKKIDRTIKTTENK